MGIERLSGAALERYLERKLAVVNASPEALDDMAHDVQALGIDAQAIEAMRARKRAEQGLPPQARSPRRVDGNGGGRP